MNWWLRDNIQHYATCLSFVCAVLLPGVEVVPEYTEQRHREKQQAHTVNHSPVINITQPPAYPHLPSSMKVLLIPLETTHCTAVRCGSGEMQGDAFATSWDFNVISFCICNNLLNKEILQKQN